jgi:hypothetical protein
MTAIARIVGILVLNKRPAVVPRVAGMTAGPGPAVDTNNTAQAFPKHVSRPLGGRRSHGQSDHHLRADLGRIGAA